MGQYINRNGDNNEAISNAYIVRPHYCTLPSLKPMKCLRINREFFLCASLLSCYPDTLKFIKESIVKHFLKSLIALLVLFSIGLANAKEEKGIKFVSSKFEAAFYGYLKVDMIYDDSSTFFGNINFWANPENGGSDNQFNFTANQTRLGFSIKGPNIWGGTPKGVIEMDFYGGGNENTPNLRLYRTFLQIKWPSFEFLVGQDWDTHSTLYPTNLNFAYLANAGNIQYRRLQLRLTKYFSLTNNQRFILASSMARTIATDMDGLGKNDGDDSGLPTYEGRLAYENKIFNNVPLMLAFSGHFGVEEVDWDALGNDQKYNSWSLNAEFILPIFSFASFKGEFFYGKNLDAYYGGIAQGINPDTRVGIKARGGWGELTINATKSLTLHTGAGIDRPYRFQISNGDRYQNIAVYGNVYYKIVGNFTAAFEYYHFKTYYKNSPNGDDNRFHTSLIYGF